MNSIAPLPQERAGSPMYAVVTGSDSGIGRAVALAFAGGGADVGITYHSDADGAAETARQARDLGVRAAVQQMDLTGLPTSASAIDKLSEQLGGIDVLVNCAGTGSSELVMDMEFER